MRIGQRVAVCGPPRTATKWLVKVIKHIEGESMRVVGKGAHDLECDPDDMTGPHGGRKPILVTLRSPEHWIESMYWDLKAHGWTYPCTPEVNDMRSGSLGKFVNRWVRSPGLVMKVWQKYLAAADIVVPVFEDEITTALIVNHGLRQVYGKAPTFINKKGKGTKGDPLTWEQKYNLARVHADAFDHFNRCARFACEACGIWDSGPKGDDEE